MSPCPSPETLSQLARDPSSGSHFATIEAHVQICAHCQIVLERLAADASVSLGRASGRLAVPEHPRARGAPRRSKTELFKMTIVWAWSLEVGLICNDDLAPGVCGHR